MTKKFFTVDAALLEELGERLIGRSHIALAEIVKNAYDADASICEIVIRPDRIVVTDNGVGMNSRQFEGFYLRLAGQQKRSSEVSPELGRRLTGSKGVGRLAAQFLGSRLKVETVRKGTDDEAVLAILDWSRIHAGEDLEKFPVITGTIPREGLLQRRSFPGDRPHGTRIVVERLRRDLDSGDIEDVGRELWSLRSPFERESNASKPDPKAFSIVLDTGVPGAEEAFDRVIADLTTNVWRAKISGRVVEGRRSDRAEISIEFSDGYPNGAGAEVYHDEVRLSDMRWKAERGETVVVHSHPLLDDVRFTILVYKLEKRQRSNVPLSELKDYLEQFGSVSLFDAGFRLPYYGIDNDWLENGADYGRRLSTSQLLPSKWRLDARYMLDLPEPRRLFGYVHIGTNHESTIAERSDASPGEWLEIQSGRDRLVDNAAHRQLQGLVRYALDLYANRFRARIIRSQESSRDMEPAERKFSRLRHLLHENRDVIPAVVFETIEREATDAEKAASATEDLFDARTIAIAPLAAAGITALALTHELGRETRFLESAGRRLDRIAKELGRPELKAAADDIRESLKRLRALQNLFVPLMSSEDREGKEPLRVRPIVRQVAASMAPLVPGMGIAVDVDDDLYFPPGPLAAWNAILQNALANCWNASLESPQASVSISGLSDGRRHAVRISDKGIGGIDLASQDRLFDAFERNLKVSREHEAVAIGGQGLGLAIVRMLCESHGVQARFVEPAAGFATTLELSWRV